MTNNISPLIESQIPQYVRGRDALFVEFLKTYYAYVSQRDAAIGLIQNNHLNKDIDQTEEALISEFWNTYAQHLPKNVAIDKRNFIKHLNEVYESKGTEKSLRLLFKMLFNDDITVTYPTENVLRASGGNWSQENFITVTKRFGQVPDGIIDLTVTNITGDYVIRISRVVSVDDIVTRLYYRSVELVSFVDDQLVQIYNEDGETLYVGQLLKSPSKLVVRDSGAGWLLGQVITMPGTTKPTIARVTGVTPTGGITSVEILEHGFTHSPGQSLVVSPYPNRPSNSVLNITKVLVSPGVFNHTISVSDFTDGCFEIVSGVGTSMTSESYFLEDYVQTGYSGTVLISQLYQPPPSLGRDMDTGLSITDWLASRATVIYTSENVVRTKGYYADDSSKISNQEVKLQDSNFYQAFSYVIGTTKDISEYQDVLKLTHPAGTKRFSQINKNYSYAFNFSAVRAISVDVLNFLDIIETFNANAIMIVGKNLSSSITTSGDTSTQSLSKVLAETSLATDLITTKTVDKALLDTTALTDIGTLSFSKVLQSDVTITDSTVITNGTQYVSSASASESLTQALNKNITDSVAATSTDTSSVVSTSYTTGDYFSEQYVENEITLTIG